MDPLEFLKYAAPLAAIAGVAYAIVQQVFKFTWRVAQLEERADAHDDDVASLQKICQCVPRIETLMEQLLEDRRATRLIGS